MPGPFPGMDPYLERPARWPSVHNTFITVLSFAINDLLPPDYVSTTGERLYIARDDCSIYPDVMVVEHTTRIESGSRGTGGTAVAERYDLPTIVSLPASEMREVFIEIRPVGDDGRVVTVIEVLSYANKTPGESRNLYLTKQEEVLHSESHLLEIDLLRGGQTTVAPGPEGLRTIESPWDYIISLHRSGWPWRYEVWPFGLKQKLPCIAVPLADGDPDVAVDLQEVFNRCYEQGFFERLVDYRREPDPPLSEEDAAWAAALLKENGLRE